MVGGGGWGSATPNQRPTISGGSQELAPPYFFSLTAEWDDLRDAISDTSQCAVSANH